MNIPPAGALKKRREEKDRDSVKTKVRCYLVIEIRLIKGIGDKFRVIDS